MLPAALAEPSERDRKIYNVADFKDGFEYEVCEHDCSRLLDLFQSQVKSQERATRISLPILRLVFDKGRAYLPKSETITRTCYNISSQCIVACGHIQIRAT